MMLSENIDYFRAKPMNVHKITILVDSGYHPDFIMRELEKSLSTNWKENSYGKIRQNLF